MKSYLYTLNCPFTNQIKYVGVSIKPKKRFNTHLSEARQSTSTRKKAWIKGLLNQNLKPVLNIISEHDKDEIHEIEKSFILKCKEKGIELYNLTSGGEIKKEVSQSTKDKLRQYNLGKKQSIETIQKRVEKLKGQKRTKEVRKRMSQNQKGKNNSMIKSGADFTKQIEAMKKANTGKKRDKSVGKKIAEKLSAPVIQLDLNENFIKEWKSIMGIQRELGFKNGDISSVCKGAIRKGYVRKTAYGFKWKYKKDYEKVNKENNS